MHNPFYELLTKGIFGFVGGTADPRVAANDIASGRADPLALITTVVRGTVNGIRKWVVIPVSVSFKRQRLFKDLYRMTDAELKERGIARIDIPWIAFNAFDDVNGRVVGVPSVTAAVAKTAANDHPVKDGEIAA